jgi:hypothetical protein
MSAEFLARVIVTSAFNDPLLQAVMKGVAHLSSTPHRVRLPCMLDMINHIISINTVATASLSQLMLATGVAVAYFLCLRSSEYIKDSGSDRRQSSISIHRRRVYANEWIASINC